MTPGPAALETLLRQYATEPSRTGSLIITVFGDAIAPRGGEVAMANLLDLLGGMGIAPGVVRTAMSRLAADGWLESERQGRLSFYRLAARGRAEFDAAEPRIYGPLARAWDGALHLGFVGAGADRPALEAAGYGVLAPGVLAGWEAMPQTLQATGEPALLRGLAARAWPLSPVAEAYREFVERFTPLACDVGGLGPEQALIARIMLIHVWRRAVLRDPRLPSGLLPDDWPGVAARALCRSLYAALEPASERRLDQFAAAAGGLPRRSNPARRFTDGPPEVSGGDK